MKILAIRGENLASLAGAFELDLAQAPFTEAGLFMISGPTGAGKSTILDAVCLALFDRTPRLQGRGRRVGFLNEGDREVLNSLDPRCLLRRGAAEGFAEVEFEGAEGRRWQATWSVRRARRKSDGRLQPQTMRLVDLETGIAHGGTKTQTLEAIEEALGLDYDGFCRSVLLAQGEFASFLRAAPTEKAALLERVTGTQLYGALSVAAHRRASWARQLVARFEAELDGLTLLAEDDRSALEVQRAAAQAELDAARSGQKQAEAALTWQVGWSEREAAASEAHTAFEAAGQAWSDAAAERTELAAAEAVQPLRGLLETHDVAQAAHATAEAAIGARAREAEAASAQLVVASQAATAAREAAVAARQAREDRAPELERALALDLELRQAEQSAQEATGLLERIEAEGATAEATRFQRAQDRDAVAAKRVAAEAWLAERAHDAVLAGQWPRWERLLQRLLATTEAVPTCRAVVEERRVAERAAQASWEEAQAKVEAERVALGRAEATWQAERAAGSDPQAERAGLEERRVTLTELRGLGERIAGAHGAAQAAEAESEAAAQAREDALSAGRVAATDAERLATAEGEAERALASARASLGLAEQRHDLVDGEACPLCGAHEHPYAEDLPPFSRFVAEQAERVAAIRAELAIAQAGVERAAVQAETASRHLAVAQAQHERAVGDRHATEQRWLARAWTLGWSLGETLIGDERDLHEQAEATDARLAKLLDETLAQLGAAKAREEALARAREVVGQRREAHAAAREGSLRAEQQAQAARQALSEATRAFEEQRALQVELGQELNQAFPVRPEPSVSHTDLGSGSHADSHTGSHTDWREAAERDPASFLERCREAALAFQAETVRHAEALEALARLEPELEAATQRVAVAQAQRVEAAATARQRAQSLAALRAQRVALLGGQPVEGVRAQLEQAVRRTRTEEEAAQADRAQAAEASATITARATEAQEALASAATRARARADELKRALASAGLDLETLRARLARDGTWLAEVRQRRDALGQALAAARATLEERRAQRARHVAQGAERGWAPVPGAEARAALEANVVSELERGAAAEERLRGVAARLDADTRARERADAMGPTLERERKRAEVWQSLNGLIGSADGKSFRVFAQSLTLELLLEQANTYLEELAPRYRLQRVRGADLDLQVIDRVMGDEVRAVSSLSGGETFLASLALALGLSSLSAKDTRVDSLFIDEGFGSLDPESQELALATLDALQASGRQVALISHVPGLADRIGVGVRVVPEGQGRSSVEVTAA